MIWWVLLYLFVGMMVSDALATSSEEGVVMVFFWPIVVVICLFAWLYTGVKEIKRGKE